MKLIHAALSFLLLATQVNQAQGLCCIAVDPVTNKEEIFPLVGVTANAIIVDGVAEVKVAQLFQTVTDNFLNDRFITRYEMPLDNDASIHSFRASYNSRVITGIVKSAEDAQDDYDEAVENGDSAFLGEQDEPGMFKMSFGNVPLNVVLIVEFTYVAPLESLTLQKYRFEMPSSFGPIIESAISIPGQSTGDFEDGIFSLSVRAYSSNDGAVSITSPSHTIGTSSISGGTQATLTDTEQNRRDVVLFVETPEATGIGTSIYTESLPDGSHALLLSIAPETSDFTFSVPSVEFIFVIDRSGSMSGEKIDQTSTAMRIALENLPSGSLFNFVGFGTTFEYLFGESKEINNSSDRQQALNYVNNLDASFGGTNIFDPVESILESPPSQGFLRIVMILTDGRVENRDDVIDYVSANQGSTRFFTIGFGDADEILIQGIARAGNGSSEFVDDVSLISEVVLRQINAISSNVFLSGFSVAWGDPENGVKAPYNRRVIYGDKRSFFYFLTESGLPSQVTVRALVAGQENFEVTIGSSDYIDLSTAIGSPTTVISRMGAKERIKDLEEGHSEYHLMETVDENAVGNEIIRVGVKYQIVSTETSFIAVDNEDWTSVNGADQNNASPPPPPPSSSGGGGGFGACFPAEARVVVAGRGSTKMEDLHVGDRIRGKDGQFSKIVEFGHKNPETFSKFLEISIATVDTFVASSDHLVFVFKDDVNLEAVPVSNLSVGDKLVVVKSTVRGYGQITAINHVIERGLFAPLTVDGFVEVNNVLASSYVSLQTKRATFHVMGLDTGISWHWLSHSFHVPNRYYCSVFDCSETWNTSDGMPVWIWYMVRLFEMIDESAIQVAVSPLLLTAAFLLSVVDLVLMSVGVAGTAGIVGYTAFVFIQPRKGSQF